MNDGVPMLGLIAVCVAVIVGLYALDVAPRQGNFGSNRAWWPSYTATSSQPSYSGSSYSSAPASAPAQATSGSAQPAGGQQPPAPSDQLQYDNAPSQQGAPQPYQQGPAPQGPAPQYGQGQPPPSDRAPQQPQQPQPQQPQYGPPAQ